MRVYVDEVAANRLPETLRLYVAPPRFEDGRRLVLLDRWSFDATNSPLYPQNRFRLGIALAIEQAADLGDRLRVEIDGPANRWTGERTTRVLTGRDEIVRESQRYWLNARPR
jgi:hypothetical protein